MTTTAASFVLASYYHWADQMEDRILKWADPSEEFFRSAPTQEYAFTSFSTFLPFFLLYVVFVVGGTWYMKRPSSTPINTSGIQFLYNPIQVMLSSYLVIECISLLIQHDLPIYCMRCNAKKPVFGRVVWLFYVTKLIDLLDTVFIILNQKWRQLSFLHVYHHSMTCVLYWLNTRVAYDGDMYMTVLLNSAVHVVMYLYYFVSQHTKHVWWKKYVTRVQIIQFIIMQIHAVYIFTTGCSDQPYTILCFYVSYICSLLVLFINFYIQSYRRGPKEKKV